MGYDTRLSPSRPSLAGTPADQGSEEKVSRTSLSSVGWSLPNSVCGTLMYRQAVSVSSVAFSHQIGAARSLWATSMSSWPLVSMR